MSEKDKYLILLTRYPLVFGDLAYVACGYGWYELIENLAGELDTLIKEWLKTDEDKFCKFCEKTEIEHPILEYLNEEKTEVWSCNNFKLRLPSAAQVKSKFGGLRWYPEFFISGMSELIAKYEHLSFETCETCGDFGELTGGSWLMVLCKKCKGAKYE